MMGVINSAIAGYKVNICQVVLYCVVMNIVCRPARISRISKGGGVLFGGKVDLKPKGGLIWEKMNLCTIPYGAFGPGGGLRTPPGLARGLVWAKGLYTVMCCIPIYFSSCGYGHKSWNLCSHVDCEPVAKSNMLAKTDVHKPHIRFC